MIIRDILKKFYAKSIELSKHKRATYFLAASSFFDACLIPFPPDFLLIPMYLSAPQRFKLYLAIATLFATLGGIIGYLLGYTFNHIFLEPDILISSDNVGVMKDIISYLKSHGVWLLVISGFLPIPFKIFTISAGILKLPLGSFVIASMLSRALKFIMVWRLIVLTKKNVWRLKLPKMLLQRWHWSLLTIFLFLLIIYVGVII